jgi:hydroxypyruvate isomerase
VIPPLAVNISLLLCERPLLDRPAAVAELGFAWIELWWPFDRAVPSDSALEALADAVERAGVGVALLNLYHGPYESDRGLLARPTQRATFRSNLTAAIDLAGRLRARCVSAHYGNDGGRGDAVSAELAVEHLALAADEAGRIGAMVVVEPLNRLDNPRYGLGSSASVVELAERVKRETGRRVGLQYDIYHATRMGEDPVRDLPSVGPLLGHVQLADVPGRSEPGTGTIAWDKVLVALAESGYDGVVGLEYAPGRDSVSSLASCLDILTRSGAPNQ